MQKSLDIPAVWDISIVDKLLYLVTPIILIVNTIALMFLMRDLRPPVLSASCWTPAQFSYAETQAAEKSCLSNGSTIHTYSALQRESEAVSINHL